MKNKIIIIALLLCSFFVSKSWGQGNLSIAGGGEETLFVGQAANYSINNPGQYELVGIKWNVGGAGEITPGTSYTNSSVSITALDGPSCGITLNVQYTEKIYDLQGHVNLYQYTSATIDIATIIPILDRPSNPFVIVQPNKLYDYPPPTDLCSDIAFPDDYKYKWSVNPNYSVPNATDHLRVQYPTESLLTPNQLSSGIIATIDCNVDDGTGQSYDVPASDVYFKLNTPVITGTGTLTACEGPTNQLSLTYSVPTLPSNIAPTSISWTYPSAWSVVGSSSSPTIKFNTQGYNYGGNITAQVIYSPNNSINSDVATFPVTNSTAIVTNFSAQLSGIPNSYSCVIKWSASNTDCAGVTGYNIMSGGAVLATVSGIATNTCSVTLSPCSSYNLYVVAMFDTHNVGSSNIISVTTPSAPPAPFVINSAVPAQGINIFGTWINSFTMYEIDLNPGFSYSASGSNSFTLIGTNTLPDCGPITPRSSSADSSSTALIPSTKASAISGQSSAQQMQPKTQTIFPKTVTSATTTNVIVYPNPTNDKINLSILNFAGSAQIAVYDFSGNQVYSTNSSTSQTVIDLSSYPAGIYLINITSGKMSKTVKVIRN